MPFRFEVGRTLRNFTRRLPRECAGISGAQAITRADIDERTDPIDFRSSDGGIDFVMRPAGRFFQVTEVDRYDKYLLDIDKVNHFSDNVCRQDTFGEKQGFERSEQLYQSARSCIKVWGNLPAAVGCEVNEKERKVPDGDKRNEKRRAAPAGSGAREIRESDAHLRLLTFFRFML